MRTKRKGKRQPGQRSLPVLVVKTYVDAKGKVWAHEYAGMPWATVDEIGAASHAIGVRLRLLERDVPKE